MASWGGEGGDLIERGPPIPPKLGHLSKEQFLEEKLRKVNFHSRSIATDYKIQ